MCVCADCCPQQAEVQGKNQDGGIQLHTRSSKFGKVSCTPTTWTCFQSSTPLPVLF